MLDYGQPTQSELGTITAAEAARHLAEGQFPPGSMGPKIEAALRFLADGGELALITSPDLLAATLTGAGARSGTRIERSAPADRSPAPADRSPADRSPADRSPAPAERSPAHAERSR